MMIRLQKILAEAGITSRRKAEELILQGLVEVNGQVVDELGAKADPATDEIRLEGKRLKPALAKEVWAFYKPKAVVTSLHDPEGRTTVEHFMPRTAARLFPVGRLDYDAEGLLLLTNDGDLANKLMHPKSHVWKEYLVKLKGRIPQEAMASLRKGPILDGKKRKPVQIKLLHYKDEKTWVSVCLSEGIKHQIKKMFLAAGYPVLKIKRIRVGSVDLGELEPGQSRRLGAQEVATLLEQSEAAPKKSRA